MSTYASCIILNRVYFEFLKVPCHFSATATGFIKTNAKISFTITFWVHWIQFLSSTAQNGIDGNELNLEKLGQYFLVWMQYNPKMLKLLIWKNSFDLVFLVPKEWCCFWIKHQVSFFFFQLWPKNSKSYDLKTVSFFRNWTL